MPKANADAAAALRDVAPRDFVRARNALAARLAKDGKANTARQIGRLRRPSPVVWALNRTAPARPDEYGALIQAVDRLRRAQLGQGDLRAATASYRAAFEPLARSTVRALRDAGSAVSPALERRLRSTLLAAVTDRRLRSDLAAGRLVDEHAEPGFEILSRGPVPAEFLRARPEPAKSPGPAREPKTPKAAPQPRGRTGIAEAEARRAAQQAQRELRALERLARGKERMALAAEKDVMAARQRLQELEEKGRTLRAAADQAKETFEKTGERARAGTTRTR
jgi:hypothetical protein